MAKHRRRYTTNKERQKAIRAYLSKPMTVEEQVLVRYQSWRSSVVEVSSWDSILNFAMFASIALGYSTHLDFVLPIPPSILLNQDGSIKRLDESQSTILHKALKLIEMKFKKGQIYNEFEVQGKIIKWDLFRKHIKFVRDIFHFYSRATPVSTLRQQQDVEKLIRTQLQTYTKPHVLIRNETAKMQKARGSQRTLRGNIPHRAPQDPDLPGRSLPLRSTRTKPPQKRRTANVDAMFVTVRNTDTTDAQDEDYEDKPVILTKKTKKSSKVNAASVARQAIAEEKKRRKRELHNPTISSLTSFTETRPLFRDAFAAHAATIYNGESTQALLFEQLRIGEKGTDGRHWSTDISRLQAFWVMQVSSAGFYAFEQSHESFHMEIDTQANDAGLTELDEIRQAAEQHNIEFHSIPSRGSSFSNPFLRVAHSDSAVFQSLVEDLRFDAPGLLKHILHMYETKHPALEKDNNEHRGTIHCNIGFGNQAFNHDFQPNECHTVSTFPVMINIDQESIYKAIGHLADKATSFVDDNCSDYQKHYYDSTREALAGTVFANLMDALKSRFEAATIAVTILGTVADLNAGTSIKKHKLLRHQDGPNDSIPGYNITVVFWCLIVLNGVVYRLTIIFYSRLKIREAVNRETKWMRPAMDKLSDYASQVLDYNTLHQDQLQQEQIYQIGQGEPMKIRVTLSTADPMGYYSGFVDTIDRVRTAYPKIPYARLIELYYLACLSNCAPYFTYIVLRWLPEGPNPFDILQNGDIDGPNLIFRYFQECTSIGAHPKNGKLFRWQYPHHKIYENTTDEEMRDHMRLFQFAIDNANDTHDPWDFQSTFTYVCGLEGMGEVTSLSFYNIGIHTGFLHSGKAREASLEAFLSSQSAFAKYLANLGCPKSMLNPTIKRLAFMRNESVFITENLGCKSCRELETKDVYLHDQWLYRRHRTPDTNHVTLQRRKTFELNWQVHNPCIPKPITT